MRKSRKIALASAVAVSVAGIALTSCGKNASVPTLPFVIQDGKSFSQLVKAEQKGTEFWMSVYVMQKGSCSGNVTLSITDLTSETNPELPVIELDGRNCRGYESVTLVPGTYKVMLNGADTGGTLTVKGK